MAYWIFENDETIGPLRAVEVMERGDPGTMVSHGQEWVRLDEHPDFAAPHRQGESSKSVTPPDINSAGRKGEPVKPQSSPSLREDLLQSNYWVLHRKSNGPMGPYTREKIMGFGIRNLKVSYRDEWLKIGDHPDFKDLVSRNDRGKTGFEKKHALALVAVFSVLIIGAIFLTALTSVSFVGREESGAVAEIEVQALAAVPKVVTSPTPSADDALAARFDVTIKSMAVLGARIETTSREYEEILRYFPRLMSLSNHVDGWGMKLLFVVEPDDWFILSAGQDRTFLTWDDLIVTRSDVFHGGDVRAVGHNPELHKLLRDCARSPQCTSDSDLRNKLKKLGF